MAGIKTVQDAVQEAREQIATAQKALHSMDAEAFKGACIEAGKWTTEAEKVG